jgi:hypothetical protein
MKSFLPAAAVSLGVVLLVGSAAWAILFPASRTWTEEKSIRMTELGDKATALQLQIDQAKSRPSMHAGQNPAELKGQYDEVAAEYADLHKDFLNASNSPKTASSFLRWSGIAFVAAGALLVFVNRGG